AARTPANAPASGAPASEGTAAAPGPGPSAPATPAVGATRAPPEQAEQAALSEGDAAFDRGELQRARAAYERAAAIAPSSPRAPVRLVRTRSAELGLAMA